MDAQREATPLAARRRTRLVIIVSAWNDKSFTICTALTSEQLMAPTHMCRGFIRRHKQQEQQLSLTCVSSATYQRPTCAIHVVVLSCRNVLEFFCWREPCSVCSCGPWRGRSFGNGKGSLGWFSKRRPSNLLSLSSTSPSRLSMRHADAAHDILGTSSNEHNEYAAQVRKPERIWFKREGQSVCGSNEKVSAFILRASPMIHTRLALCWHRNSSSGCARMHARLTCHFSQ